MRLRGVLPPDNPARAWGRRVFYGTRSRPDVQIGRLERRIDILEQVADLDGRARAWAGEYASLLAPQQVSELRLARVGSVHDGGYVLPVDLVRESAGIVSIGVGDNNEADIALAEKGLRVQAWDHTVDGLPVKHPLITFHRQGVGSAHENLRPLDDIVTASFGDQSDRLVLLIDAEGAEWESLTGAADATLDRISVLGIEFHHLGTMLVDPEPYIRVLRRLREVFVPVAVHANNYMPFWDVAGVRVADALEVTYVNRRVIRGRLLTDGNCASALFAPCCPDLPDVELPWASCLRSA